MTKKKDTAGRIQLFLMSLVFFGPLILAAWLYLGDSDLRPTGRTNHGVLLEPMVNIEDLLPGTEIQHQASGRWLLIYMNDGVCDEACETALYVLRQARLALGKEMDRLARVFLHGNSAPDTVLLADEHKGLITLRDSELTEQLTNKKPAEFSAGGYYLVDPLGNLVMYFQPGIDSGDMVDDIEHLLELSRIG